ncbi:MAG: DUF2087 domain-containing protein [Anaerolineae bacterium]|jgi:hypothetical protein|nr:DUF2087 domain-containing protein [Anaerolineae bacterium]
MTRIEDFLDLEGRVTRWPAGKGKMAEQELILAYLSEKFTLGVIYTEREVNQILKSHHTFEDWAILRRELFERGYLNRDKDGSRYWRTPNVTFF